MIEYTVKVYPNGSKFWWLNEELHREDGPAIEWLDGTKEWYLNGVELSEQDFNTRMNTKELTINPIVELLEYTVKVYPNGSKFWYLNGVSHREDGPAVERYDGTKYWYLNGVKLSEEEFNVKMNPKELTINKIEELLGYKIKVVGND